MNNCFSEKDIEEGLTLSKTPNYFIVEAGALPEIFLKVAEAKRLLETGEVDTVNAATRREIGRAHV